MCSLGDVVILPPSDEGGGTRFARDGGRDKVAFITENAVLLLSPGLAVLDSPLVRGGKKRTEGLCEIVLPREERDNNTRKRVAVQLSPKANYF